MIPQIKPWIDNDELDQLKRVVESTYVTENILTKEFEELTKAYSNSKFAIAICNGTMATYCILKALNIGVGDEVIVPDMTFIATSNAVIMTGATPIFCDISINDLGIDPTTLESLITRHTKAIMPVHLYGQAADMDRINSIAKKYSIHVIEDAAQGVGVFYKNKHTGTLSDAGVLSYYGNKTLTCGECGIILTQSKELAQLCYRIKNHGRDKKGTFIHDHIGYNFCFTEMQAAIGISQMNKLARIISLKQTHYDIYHSLLKDIDEFQPIAISSNTTQPVHWFTSFWVKDINRLQEFLLDQGIQTRRFFYPLHRQPCYQHLTINGDFKTSNYAYENGLSLPSSYDLTEVNQRYIAKKIKEFYENRH